MRKNLLLGLLAVLSLSLSTQAQTVLRTIQGAKGLHPHFIVFDEKNAPSFVNGSVILPGLKNKIVRQGNTSLIKQEADALGYTHYRYQQMLNGIPVEDAVYILHVKSNKVLSENGRWVKDVPKLQGSSSLQESSALRNALQNIHATVYKWQEADEEALLKRQTGNPLATYYPKGKLVYYSDDDELTPENLRLAYKFDVYATEPLSRKYIYVDAIDGKVLGSKELIENVNGTAITAYSGTRTIQTTQSGSNYVLRETTRGNGISTFNLKKGTNYNAAVDFTDADNTWNNVNANLDQYATDAHFGAEMTYDFYKTNFNRNSIDNNGFAILSYVHYKKNYFNAFWDGTRMTYGDGDASDGNKPLTALDVCGHEITHGLTSFTANLNYKNESGALNEGFSDCLGTAIEFFARPEKADWLIGSDFETIRDMSNPNAYSQPDTYKGKYWAKGLSARLDNGGVHTNSGVLNYWFYLVSAGGSGTNDNGTAYNVSGITIAKAQAITYRTLTTYLVPTSVYADARTYSIKAATDLYGAGSNEVTQVTNAWNAVGVAATTSIILEEDALPVASSNTLGISNINILRQYPNPVRNQFTLEFTNDRSSSGSALNIYNIYGAKVYQKTITVSKGLNVVNISLPHLSSGAYILKLNNNRISTIQVVK